jgi:hypothetical protein
MATELALLALHVRFEDCPLSIVEGDADSETVGAGGGGGGVGGGSTFATAGGGTTFL